MFDDPPPPLRRWLRHTASVPKGFLRFHVLKLLREKPMSGSEIMEEVEKQTDGRWRPSPGSVYPLLGWLQAKGYTKDLPRDEGWLKRYMLTEKGSHFFEEHASLGERLKEKLELSSPLPFGRLWVGATPEKLIEIRDPIKRFAMALFNLRKALRGNMTDRAIREVGEFLNSTAEKIEEMNKKVEKADAYGDTDC